MQRFNFSYDLDEDDLFLYSLKSKSRGSIEMGNFIFDYDSKKELVGLQIMKASRFLKDIAAEDTRSIKETLVNLIECKIDIKKVNNMLMIKLYLTSQHKEAGRKKELSPIISIPNIQEPSPALAYA